MTDHEFLEAKQAIEDMAHVFDRAANSYAGFAQRADELLAQLKFNIASIITTR